MTEKEISKLTIDRMTSIIKDIVWICINSYQDGALGHPAKFLINDMIMYKGAYDIALRMAAHTDGVIKLCNGLDLHWQHTYNEKFGIVVNEFVIKGEDVDEMEYTTTIENLIDYFDHLSSTSSRTF